MAVGYSYMGDIIPTDIGTSALYDRLSYSAAYRERQQKKDDAVTAENDDVAEAAIETPVETSVETVEEEGDKDNEHSDRFSSSVIVAEDGDEASETINYLKEREIKLKESLQLQMELMKLDATDTKVRAHERAHQNAGGIYASAPIYEYTTGPDGGRYAVSGSVNIDTSRVPNNPEATITKMDIVRRAALAPVDPSAADIAIANRAVATQIQARKELADRENTEKLVEEQAEKEAIRKAIASYERTDGYEAGAEAAAGIELVA